MKGLEFLPDTVLRFGDVVITDTVVFTWIVMVFLSVSFHFVTRGFSLVPSPGQEMVEALFESIKNLIEEALDVDAWDVIPLLGTLWIFIGASNLIGLVPGLKTPTADINTTFAFAVISYVSIHFYGIRYQGIKGYISHYTEPSVFLLPFHLLADVTRIVALAIRLFGNMLSGEMIAAILLVISGLLVPVPMALLHVVIGVVQAYIFGALTLAFISGGIVMKHKKT
jgi:F-type H+-transporting ATPase subunit a